MLAVPQVAAMTMLCAIKDTPGGASCSVMGTGHPYPADGQKAGSTHTSEPYESHTPLSTFAFLTTERFLFSLPQQFPGLVLCFLNRLVT